METFLHCRDKCLHSVVYFYQHLGVNRTHMIINVFPPIDTNFFFPGTNCQCGAGSINSSLAIP